MLNKYMTLFVCLSCFVSPSFAKNIQNTSSTATHAPTPIVIPTAVKLCDNKNCDVHETRVVIPIKEKYAKRNLIHQLLDRYVSQAVKRVDGKSNKNLNDIELEMKGSLYRDIEQIDRSLNDKVLEKYLIDIKIEPIKKDK